MKKNAYVTIIASPELSEMRLDELVGRRGLVVEDLPQNRKKNRGGLVLLEDIIRKSKCSTDFKRNDFLKKNEAYPLGALRSLKFAYRKLRISLFVELAV